VVCFTHAEPETDFVILAGDLRKFNAHVRGLDPAAVRRNDHSTLRSPD
jgi:hypothetical protein